MPAAVDFSDDRYARWRIPGWARWLLAAATIIVLFVGAIHLQQVGRSLVTFPQGLPLGDALNLLDDTPYVPLMRSALWVLLTLAFLVVGYLLAASVWGGLTALQGGALGLLIFGMLTSAGSGWNAAVSNAGNPLEPWRPQANARGAFLLRETLMELAMRESGGFRYLPVTAVVDDSGVITEDGAVAWALRDFPEARFVTSVQNARGDEIVLLNAPPKESELPDLGTSYVGQGFVLSLAWDPQSLPLGDLIGWWTQRQSRVEPTVSGKVIVWVRQDVFEGVPFPEAARG
jgi:hypothetical protein